MSVFKQNILVGGVLLILATSCGFRESKDEGGQGGSVGAGSARIAGFNTLKTGVFAAKCAGCHGDQRQAARLNMMDYASVTARLDAIRDRVLVRKDMPPGAPLSADEQEAVRAWLDAQAPENDVDRPIAQVPPPVPQPSATAEPEAPVLTPGGTVNFETVKTQVLQPNCLGCHDGGAASDLSTYELVKARLEDIEEAALIKKFMPPKRTGDKLTDEEQAILRAWIDQGATQ